MQGNHKSEKTFLLKTFQRKSSEVKIFCCDTRLIFFYIFSKYTTIKLSLYKLSNAYFCIFQATPKFSMKQLSATKLF